MVLTVVSLLKIGRQGKDRAENENNTDLRGFFEANRDPLSSSALFLSLIVASQGRSEQRRQRRLVDDKSERDQSTKSTEERNASIT